MASTHQNFSMLKSGLIINEQFPQFIATPYSLANCECHAEGYVETKCVRDINIFELRDLKELWLVKCTSGDELTLNQNYNYFYQVQMQLALGGRMHCDLVVWTKKSLFIQSIFFMNNFGKAKAQRLWNFMKKLYCQNCSENTLQNHQH